MTATSESSVALPSGETISALGQGTWHFAERPERRASEITSLRLGIDLGMTVIDTAEMYADGAAEVLVGKAIAGRRDDVFLVNKVLPQHAVAGAAQLVQEPPMPPGAPGQPTRHHPGAPSGEQSQDRRRQQGGARAHQLLGRHQGTALTGHRPPATRPRR
jgi:aryl-alcohol dehydrogenase-like predicted oxidoreductase